MSKSKVAIAFSQIIEKIEIIIGGVWAFIIFLVALFSMLYETKAETDFIIFMWVLGFFGVWVYLKGRRRKKMRLEFKRYVAHLSVDSSAKIENLASITNTSVNVVKKNLRFMIKKNFFVDTYIDEKNNQLVFPSIARKEQQMQAMASTSATQPMFTVCNCPSCGGVNKIPKGMVEDCDFCGTPLQG